MLLLVYLSIVSLLSTTIYELRIWCGFEDQYMILNVLTTLGMLVLILIQFSGDYRNKIAVLFLRFLLILASEGSSLLLIGTIIGYGNFLSFINSGMAGFASLFFDFIFCVAISKIRKSGIYMTSRILFFEIILSIITSIGWTISQNIIVKNNRVASHTHYYLTIIFGLVLFFFYFSFELANSIHEKRLDSLFERQQYQLKERYYRHVEEQQRQISAVKHDMKNQLLTIKGYLSNKEDVKKIHAVIESVKTSL